MNGINKATEKVLLSVSKNEFIKDYILVGGTALSAQINHRISRDLDFCIWQDRMGAKLYEVHWSEIEKLLEAKFGSVKRDLIDLQQVNFWVGNVKITFFVRENVNSGVLKDKHLLNFINCATVESIGVMKLELLQRRNIFRDYYDIYSILREGYKITSLLAQAVEYSKNKLKIKSLLSILSNHEKFKKEMDFELLNPKYKVTPEEIRDYLIDEYKKENYSPDKLT
jgi:predicted nucleotidyltransferase component of viral defense system